MSKGNEKFRVLVVTPYFYPHVGGSEKYIEQLYGKLMEVDSNMEVDVLTYDTEKRGKFEEYKGFSVYRVGCWEILKGQFAIPNYFELIGLAWKLKPKKYDVVNSHTRFFDNSWWAWLLARYLGAKSLLTDHCAYHPVHKSWLVRMVAKAVDKVMIPVLGKMYDQVSVVSRATKSFLGKNGMKRSIEVVYGGG